MSRSYRPTSSPLCDLLDGSGTALLFTNYKLSKDCSIYLAYRDIREYKHNPRGANWISGEQHTAEKNFFEL
jgi:hypothetical protein